VLLDVGVHYADMMEYFLGEIQTVYAQIRLHEPIRYNAAALPGGESTSNPAGVYGRWQKQMPAEFEATAEDAAYATLTFAGGAVAEYLEDHAGHGTGIWNRQIHGSIGSMTLPHDRSGDLIHLHRGNKEIINDARLLDMVPDFHLDQATSVLFGGNRLWRYDFPFEQIDRKLIAVEYADFGLGITGERPVEVDLDQGTRSVAVSYAMLESGVAGRPLTIAEVLALAETVDAYQQEINVSLGI
jgi:predicted dehydrogenase